MISIVPVAAGIDAEGVDADGLGRGMSPVRSPSKIDADTIGNAAGRGNDGAA
jgi:hypothetical protein